MQLQETNNDGLKRGYKITITAVDLDTKVTSKIEKSRKDIQIKGFRKGQVPVSLLKKMYGKSILGETMQETVDEIVREHFAKTGDKPALQPDIKMVNEDWKEGDDMNVAIEYEKLPDIPETDFSKVKLKKLIAKIDKASIEEALSNLASSAPNYKKRAKSGKAKLDDQLIIDFLGTIDGTPFDGGKAEDYPLVLGSNSFIPGFETQLLGVKQADKVDVKVTFPENYGSEKLAGKDAAFEVTIKAVNEPKPSKIDDEMAKKFGANDLKGLKEQISERLKSEFAVATRAVLKKDLMDKIDKAVKFEIPSKLVENEASEIAQQLWHEENPEKKDQALEPIVATAEHKKIAQRRVKLGLLLADLGNQNKISVSEQETQAALRNKAGQYPGQEKAFFDFIEKNPQAKEQIKAPIFEDKVIDFILELADVSEKQVSKDELGKAIEKIDSA